MKLVMSQTRTCYEGCPYSIGRLYCRGARGLQASLREASPSHLYYPRFNGEFSGSAHRAAKMTTEWALILTRVIVATFNRGNELEKTHSPALVVQHMKHCLGTVFFGEHFLNPLLYELLVIAYKSAHILRGLLPHKPFTDSLVHGIQAHPCKDARMQLAESANRDDFAQTKPAATRVINACYCTQNWRKPKQPLTHERAY